MLHIYKMLNITKAINRQFFKEYYKRNYSRAVKNVVTQATTPPAESYELEEAHIKEAVAAQPQLSSVSKQLWERTHETFVSHGMSTKNFLQIIVKNPAIFLRSPQKNSECIENWRSCQFGEHLLHILLTTYPELLNETSERQILQRITFLKGFAATNKNVWKLLMSCPNLLSEREQIIEAKLNYLMKTMRIEVHEIVKSQALAKTLDEIRCRHICLKRLNLFALRSLKEDAKRPINNQPLHKITDTTDKNFALNVAQISVEEFEAFQDLFARELKAKDTADDEDDFEDD